jgi:hypothetical protein
MELDTGKLLWAPDSRRFAFNCRKGSKYYGSDLYELAGAAWKKLPSLQDEESIQQIANQSLTKRAKHLRLEPKGMIDGMEVWRVRRWISYSDGSPYTAAEASACRQIHRSTATRLGCHRRCPRVGKSDIQLGPDHHFNRLEIGVKSPQRFQITSARPNVSGALGDQGPGNRGLTGPLTQNFLISIVL